MTSGFDEFSLALFTTLAPAGTIAFIALALARLLERDHEAAVRIDRLAALPFSVVLVGFIASATHLGTPANALHVFSGVGRSPLSNEVLAAVAFLFLAGSYWMAAFKQHFPDSVAKPWLVLACAAGAALVACTSLAYAVDTVPTWNTWYTPTNLWFSALLAGPVIGLLFLHLARAGRLTVRRRARGGEHRCAGGGHGRADAAPAEPRRRGEQRAGSQRARAGLRHGHRVPRPRRHRRLRVRRLVAAIPPQPPGDLGLDAEQERCCC